MVNHNLTIDDNSNSGLLSFVIVTRFLGVTISEPDISDPPSQDTEQSMLLLAKKYKLKATIKPLDATNQKVTWKSSNKKVARVSRSGKVTAVSKGKATITVTTKDGKFKAKCKIVVK